MLRYLTGWQQVHERLAKQTEVPRTVLSSDGPGVPYRRRAVFFRFEKDLAGVRSDFRSGRGQPHDAFQEQQREQKRRVRVGHHHGGWSDVYGLPGLPL